MFHPRAMVVPGVLVLALDNRLVVVVASVFAMVVSGVLVVVVLLVDIPPPQEAAYAQGRQNNHQPYGFSPVNVPHCTPPPASRQSSTRARR